MTHPLLSADSPINIGMIVFFLFFLMIWNNRSLIKGCDYKIKTLKNEVSELKEKIYKCEGILDEPQSGEARQGH